MRLVAGVVRVTADLERIVKYAFRISPMFGSCSFDFGIWIMAPSVSKMSRSQLNYAASPGGFVTSTNLINLRLNSAVVPFSRSQGRAFRAESSVAPEADSTAPPAWLVAPTATEPTSRARLGPSRPLRRVLPTSQGSPPRLEPLRAAAWRVGRAIHPRRVSLYRRRQAERARAGRLHGAS